MSEGAAPSKHHTILSIFIALAATTGALVSWHASRIAGAASGEDGKAISAALDEASTESTIASEVFGYLTNARRFQIHRDNERAIAADAGKKGGAPDRSKDEWQAESSRARARLAQVNTDFAKTEGERWAFDRDRYERMRRSEMEMEKALDPAPFVARAGRLRREENLFVSLNALFAAAIFCFTAALKTEKRGKFLLTYGGGIFYLTGAAIALARVLA